MRFIKIVLTVIAIVFGTMAAFWLLGVVWSLFGYAFWLGLLAAVGYGGYKLFTRAEQKYVTGPSARGEIEDRDFSLSWEEYGRKYLNK